jgi:DNA-binding MarR family transcriptional regulator
MSYSCGEQSKDLVEPSKQDAVDLILEQWAKQRPDVDMGPLAVIARISRASRLLERARKASFVESGIQAWEFDVLAALRRHDGGPLSAGQLVESSMVSPSSMTNRIDRLESKGLVTRQLDPANRRSVQIELTLKGRTLVDEVMAAHAADEAKLISGLGQTNQLRLAALLRTLLITLGDRPG